MSSNWNWAARRARKAFLALEDGTRLSGYSVGAPVDGTGEVVFNTGMSGYQEILSDPSYHGQFVVMTYPEIGNTGTNASDMESRRLFANGLIVHELTEPSNWRNEESLSACLARQGIPAIAGVDTRALTTRLREKGTLKGYLCVTGELAGEEAVRRAQDWCGLDGQDYASKVTCEAPYEWDPDGVHSTSWGFPAELPRPGLSMVAYDFGIKWNILRHLRRCGVSVTVVPARTLAADVLARRPDGVLFSNGPADPAAVTYAVDAARQLIGQVPILGICLGHQLLGLALGGRTHRLKFGHHGCNHPVQDLATGRVEITSQNHNFVVDRDSLDARTVDITHINLNDGSVEGLAHRSEPVMSVQYHPEAGPGPHDAGYLFDRFLNMMKSRRA